ncbi:hypothetical protein Adt_15441 [Abeliophyllum distichum]|uniref:Uncharacterized protein n=1 Tax=Abeliophyllum distichum TaxID=126358 RepID=A0ABD1U2G8_9LAMI
MDCWFDIFRYGVLEGNGGGYGDSSRSDAYSRRDGRWWCACSGISFSLSGVAFLRLVATFRHSLVEGRFWCTCFVHPSWVDVLSEDLESKMAWRELCHVDGGCLGLDFRLGKPDIIRLRNQEIVGVWNLVST